MNKRKYSYDAQELTKLYQNNYQKYGHSAKSLAGRAYKQNVRFAHLTKNLGISDTKKWNVFDVGCGFGDLNKYFELKGYKNYRYTGCDLVEEFIKTANELYADHENISFICDDFMNLDINEEYDYIIAAGIFNFKMQEKDNYQHVYDVMKKAMEMCGRGGVIVFDFQSDKVDFMGCDTGFYFSPEKVLGIAYEFSRNVILDNSYMPFEFAVTIFKDDSFKKDTTVFNRFIAENSDWYDIGKFKE